MKWLDSIEENIDIAKTSARFYICKARILKSTNDLEEVLRVFEKAVKNCAQVEIYNIMNVHALIFLFYISSFLYITIFIVE